MNIEYKYNKQMLLMANKNDVSFDNDYAEVRLPKVLKETLQGGVLEEKYGEYVYYMLKDSPFCNQIAPNKFEFFYDDLTCNEYSNNKVIFETSKYDKFTLKKGISFCHKVSKILPHYHDFCIIMSIDESYVTISFHKIREGESWLGDDLEAYKLDSILVMNVRNVSEQE